MAASGDESLLNEIGSFLGIIACSESAETPSLLSVAELGCLGVAVCWEDRGLVVAVPADAVPAGSTTFTPAVEVLAAEEGTWELPEEPAVQGTVKVSFFLMEKAAIESGIEVLSGAEELDPADYECFLPDTFVVPCAADLLSAWRKREQPPKGRGRGRALPGTKRGRGRGRGEAAGGGGGRGTPRSSRTVANLEKFLEEKFSQLEQRLSQVESGSPGKPPEQEGAGAAPTAESAGPKSGGGLGGPTLLGVGGPRVDSKEALAQARRLLGVGATDNGGGLGNLGLGVPPGLSKVPAGGPETPKPKRDEEAEGSEGVIERLVRVLESRSHAKSSVAAELFGLTGGGASSSAEYEANVGSLVGGGGDLPRVSAGALGLVNMDRLIATRRSHPEVIIAANDQAVKEALGTLPGETWSVGRHAERFVLPHAGNFLTLKRLGAILAYALDEGRTRGLLHQHAFLYHAYRVVEAASINEGHDMGWAWPLLGIEDPGGRPRGGLAPVESAGLAAYHRDRLALDAARAAGSGSKGGGKGKGSGDEGAGASERAQAKAAAAAARKAAAAAEGKK